MVYFIDKTRPAISRMPTASVMRIIAIEDEMKRHPDMKWEYLSTFRDWVRKQPHLPQIDDDLLLVAFLRRCKFSIEKAKIKLDNYFTFRTHFPEMSIGRTVNNSDIKDLLRIWENAILKEKDHNGNLIILQRLITPDPTYFNPSALLKVLQVLIESHIREHGTIPGFVMIYDQKNFTLAHLAKATFTTVRKFMFFIQKCSPVSIKGVYVVNANGFMDAAMTFLKSVIQGDLVSTIEVFPEERITDLYKSIPREVLPEEYGGQGGTMKELNRQSYESIVKMRDYSDRMDRLKVDEKKRTGIKLNFGSLFGVEGSFKKLNVD